MSQSDAAAELAEVVRRYNDAWNRHDVDAICAFHAPGFVFHNHTAGEEALGDAAREHIATIFANWPDIAFSERRLTAAEGLVVSEWTARATAPDGRVLEWDGVDIFPFENGLIARKDVYSGSANPRVLSQAQSSGS